MPEKSKKTETCRKFNLFIKGIFTVTWLIPWLLCKALLINFIVYVYLYTKNNYDVFKGGFKSLIYSKKKL